MITEPANSLPDTPLAIQFYYLLSYRCCYINVVGVSLQRIILWTLSYKYKNYLLLRILYSIPIRPQVLDQKVQEVQKSIIKTCTFSKGLQTTYIKTDKKYVLKFLSFLI